MPDLTGINFNNTDDLAAKVSEIWKQRDTFKYTMERIWYEAIAFYMGEQYVEWSDQTKRLMVPEADSHRVRMTVNLMMPIIQTAKSRVYKQTPVWDVIPSSSDQSDVNRAALAKNIFEANWYRLDMDRHIIHMLDWVFTTGNCFIKQVWDPDKGTPVLVPNADGEVTVEDPVNLGDITASVVSPYSMLVDSNATNFEDAEWCIESNLVSRAELEARYGKQKIKNVPTDGTTASLSTHFSFKERIKFLTGAVGRSMSSHLYDMTASDVVVVHEVWIRPKTYGNKMRREGRHAIIAGGTVLKSTKFPYAHGELPYCHFQEIPVPGRLWATSTAQMMIPIQKDYNRTKSQIIENRNLMGNPKWLVPKNSGIEKTAIDDKPGEVLEYNFGSKPEMVQPSPLPSYIQNILSHHRADLEDVSSVHEVSRAEAPGEIRSGRGVLALIEQDESRVNLTIKLFEKQLERLGRQHLAIVAQYVREERLGRLVGDSDELAVFSYSGNDLLSPAQAFVESNVFDVKVRSTAGLPHSRAGKLAMLETLTQTGAIDPRQNPVEKKLFMEALDLGSVSNVMNNSRVHRTKQLREIEEMKNGMPVQVAEWHDHDLHIDTLKKYMNSSEYDSLDPFAQQMLSQHLEEHEQVKAYVTLKPELLMRQIAGGMSNEEGQEPQSSRQA